MPPSNKKNMSKACIFGDVWRALDVRLYCA